MSESKPLKERSSLWFLIPFFFGIIGGVVAYLIIKEDDKRKANYCLAFGIVITVLGFIILFAIGLSAIHNMQPTYNQPLASPVPNSQPIISTQSPIQTPQTQKQVGQFANTDCHRDETVSSIIHMTGKYINGATGYSSIYLQLALLDDKGTVVATGNGMISDVAPFQTKIFETTAIYSGAFTNCQIDIGSAN